MAEIILKGQGRLSSGIKASEAVRESERWWDSYGRHMTKQVANTERTQDKFRGGDGKAPAIFIRGEELDVIPSGILRGLPWDELSKSEKLRVVNNWHTEIFLKRERGRLS